MNSRRSKLAFQQAFLKTDKARDMLENTDFTIASIALETGFCDQSHFVKAFHRIYKMNPTDYRSRHVSVGSLAASAHTR